MNDHDRFWSKVDKSGECWLWTGARRAPYGYGQFYRNGGPQKAHRAAWELTNGPIPAGLFVLHSCDNPPCVRTDHLRLGTHADNMRDMNARGHGRRGHVKSICVNGHAFTPENTYRTPDARRQCRMCLSARTRAYYARKTGKAA